MVLTMTSFQGGTNPPTSTSKTWFITGATSGIGLALATAAGERGDNVVALARHAQDHSELADRFGARVLPRNANVNNPAELRDSVVAAVETFGRIDIVANNAGYGLFGAVEEATDAQARAIFDTNVHGVLNVLRATLPVLRKQGSGHVLQGSSFYGQTAHPGVGLIAATKYAVEGLTDALAGELAPLGIRVTLIEPSLTATQFLANLDAAQPISDYDQTVREVQTAIGALTPSAFNSADAVVAAILAAVDADTPPLRLATGSQAVTEMRNALTARLAELEQWAPTSNAVDQASAAA
jgi:NAD(P)-dependent dehydrogenase (short-subunit alcohol dehydrogenase family)